MPINENVAVCDNYYFFDFRYELFLPFEQQDNVTRADVDSAEYWQSNFDEDKIDEVTCLTPKASRGVKMTHPLCKPFPIAFLILIV